MHVSLVKFRSAPTAIVRGWRKCYKAGATARQALADDRRLSAPPPTCRAGDSPAGHDRRGPLRLVRRALRLATHGRTGAGIRSGDRSGLAAAHIVALARGHRLDVQAG